MGIRPSSQSSPGVVEKYIGTDVDDVISVANSIDEVIVVANNIDDVVSVANNETNINIVAENIGTTLKYLGASTSNPTQRLNGDPLEAGDYYYNTFSDTFFYLDSDLTSWTEADIEGILESASEAEAAKIAAELSAVNAQASEAAALASEQNAKNSENISTANEIATSADVVITNADAVTTTNNALITTANKNQTQADSIATANDALNTGADRVQTGLDRVYTEANAASTLADAQQTASDRVQTTSDAIQTSSDRLAVESLYDTYDDRYLGSKASDPTVDNDGDPLNIGAVYFNTVSNSTRFYNGVIWETPNEAATEAALIASTKASEANTSAINALNSENEADASAISAATDALTATTQAAIAQASEINASNSASNASSSESNAATSEVNSVNAASLANIKANEASVSASAASASETVAVTQAALAQSSEEKAEQYAIYPEDVVIPGTADYSAYHWSRKASEIAGGTAPNSLKLGGKTLHSTGNNYDVVTFVDNTGSIDIGNRIDFHESNLDTSDFSASITSNGGILESSSTFKASELYDDNNRVYSDGNKPSAVDLGVLPDTTTTDDIDDSISVNKYTTQADITKLSGIEDNATANSTDATLLDRSNHTGTQTASTISDFGLTVSANTDVLNNTAKVSFPEALINGKQYARKDAGWEEITSASPEFIADGGSYIIGATQEIVDLTYEGDGTLVLPASLTKGSRFYARVSSTASEGKLLTILNPNFTIIGDKLTVPSGTDLQLEPSQLVILEAINTTTLEII
jgi:hypothetical protein